MDLCMCSVTEAAGTSIFFLLHLLVLLEAGVEAVGLCVCVGLSRLLDWQRFISDPDGVQPLAARSAGGCVRIRLHLHASSCLSRHFPGRYEQTTTTYFYAQNTTTKLAPI